MTSAIAGGTASRREAVLMTVTLTEVSVSIKYEVALFGKASGAAVLPGALVAVNVKVLAAFFVIKTLLSRAQRQRSQ